jgi:surface polysaccharide O-acyltransferase-like enzyme
VIATRVNQGSFNGGWSLNAAFYAFWDPFVAWGIILTLLWFFRTCFPGGNAFTAALARRAYGAYIVHPPVVVGLSLLARTWTVPPLLKFGIVGPLACIGAFATASLLLAVPGLGKIL